MNVQQTVPLLMVADIKESRQFYCEGLGFEVANEWKPDGKLAWCWLSRGGAGLMLQQQCDEDPPAAARGKGVTFYFICTDVDKLYAEFTSRGIEATEPAVTFYEMKQTFLKDPDGYELCFENPTQRAATDASA